MKKLLTFVILCVVFFPLAILYGATLGKPE